MKSDQLITMRYLNDGRRVESQCSSAMRFIESGEAVPIVRDEAIYDAWLEEQGVKGIDRVVPEPEPEKEPEPLEEDDEEQGTPDPEDDPEDDEPEEEEPDEEADSDPEDTGVPDGYEIKQHGKWRSVYGPDGKKVGKGQDSFEKAVAMARDHAGL